MCPAWSTTWSARYMPDFPWFCIQKCHTTRSCQPRPYGTNTWAARKMPITMFCKFLINNKLTLYDCYPLPNFGRRGMVVIMPSARLSCPSRLSTLWCQQDTLRTVDASATKFGMYVWAWMGLYISDLALFLRSQVSALSISWCKSIWSESARYLKIA